MSVDALTMAQFLGDNRNPQNYAFIEQTGRGNTSILSAEELRNQLNLFGDTSQDTYISSVGIAATQYVSDYLGFPLCVTSYKAYYPQQIAVGSLAYLDIPNWTQTGGGPPQEFALTVSYMDANNVSQSFTNFTYDQSGKRIILQSIPTVSTTVAYPWTVSVTMQANFLATVEVVKQAVKLVATHLYNNRSATTEASLKELPIGVAQLLRPFKPLVM